MGDLSKNFSAWEFQCHGTDCCGHTAVVHENLIIGLQALRRKLQQPLHISSGFRCNRRNKEIGGAPDSMHIQGKAVDVRPPRGVTVTEMYRYAEQIPVFKEGGIGIYDTHLHLDVRKGPARWDYRTPDKKK